MYEIILNSFGHDRISRAGKRDVGTPGLTIVGCNSKPTPLVIHQSTQLIRPLTFFRCRTTNDHDGANPTGLLSATHINCNELLFRQYQCLLKVQVPRIFYPKCFIRTDQLSTHRYIVFFLYHLSQNNNVFLFCAPSCLLVTLTFSRDFI